MRIKVRQGPETARQVKKLIALVVYGKGRLDLPADHSERCIYGYTSEAKLKYSII